MKLTETVTTVLLRANTAPLLLSSTALLRANTVRLSSIILLSNRYALFSPSSLSPSPSLPSLPLPSLSPFNILAPTMLIRTE